MEPIFTIPYPEYVVVEQLAKVFKKKDGYTVFIPTSRQQKGVDLLLVQQNPGFSKCVSIQVKSSKVWPINKPSKKDKQNDLNPKFNMWFKKFESDSDYSADFNIFVGLKPVDQGETRKRTTSAWEPLMLVFSRDQFNALFVHSTDRHIYFTEYDNDKILITRGLPEIEDITRHKFDLMTSEIKSLINS